MTMTWTTRSTPRVALGLLGLFALAGVSHAQTAPLVNIGLFATAVRDSFEVRLFSNATIPQTQGLLNSTFTVAWEAAAGGTVKTTTMSGDCASYALSGNGEAVITNGASRYFTFNVNGLTALSTICPITTSGLPIAGFKMTGFTGCAHVNVVNNSFTLANNKNYYLSLGGVNRTGIISSTAVRAGFPQDMNNDGNVNAVDFGLFVNAFGGTCVAGCLGDFNADGFVNAGDFGTFVNAYGTLCL